MKIQSLFLVSIICFFCASAFAEQSATAGTGAVSGLCKDGTSYTGASKKGACRGHKGVKEWFGDKATASSTSAPVAAPVAAAAPAAASSASDPATGMCKDGTPYTGASKKGACRGHKGLKEFYGDKTATGAVANAPATAAPATATSVSGTATGLCKDGSLYSGSSKRGACRGHKGLQEWYADKQTAAPSPATAAPVAAGAPATASTPALASGAATGLCKDGTAYTGASKRGACRGHKGIKEWYADQAPTAAVPASPVPAGAAVAPAAAPASAAPVQATRPVPAAQAPAPAAGSGQVWVNTRSKIYHCEGTKFYGNTKEGEYMSEADAQAKGYNANRRKVCNK